LNAQLNAQVSTPVSARRDLNPSKQLSVPLVRTGMR